MAKTYNLGGLTYRYMIYVLPANITDPALHAAGVLSQDVIHSYPIECTADAMAVMVQLLHAWPEVQLPVSKGGKTALTAVRIEIWAGLRKVWEIGGGMAVRHGN